MEKKNKKIKNKVGSIMPEFSVKTILLILGFVILLIVIGYIAYTELIKDTTCEDSIIIRNAMNIESLPVPVDKIAPLTCTTKKLCLTQSGENCGLFGKPSKEEYIFNKRIDKTDNEKAKEQVLDKITEEMYNCQNLFTNDKGEPYEFMPPKWLSSQEKTKYCLICTRIVLDEDARKNIGYITYGELYQKLWEKKTPDGKSYLEYLHPGWQDWRRAVDLYNIFKAKYPDKVPEKFEDWKLDLTSDRGIVIVAQMTTTNHLEALKWSGAVLGGVALTATWIGAPAGIALIGSGVSAGVTFLYSAPDERYQYSPPAIYQGDIKTLQSLECNSFESAP